MLAQATGMTDGRLVAELQVQIISNGAKRGSTGMPKALVPQVGRSDAGEDARGGEFGPHNRVEVAVGITSENHHPGSKVLDRETARVKFNSYWGISTELTNRKEILNDGRTDDDIAELDRRGAADQGAGAHMGNGQSLTASDNDKGRRTSGVDGGEVTRVPSHVRAGA